MWASVFTWLTPTASLFILLNAVIATIALTSRFAAAAAAPKPTLLRPPSLLDRVKSFNFSPYYPHPDPDPPTQLARTPSLLDRLKSITLYRSDSNSSTPQTQIPQPPPEQSPESENNHGHFVNRSKSDSGTHAPAASFRRRFQKSLSEKLSWSSPSQAPETEELASAIERRRPATSWEEKEEEEEEEEEVDARADDFINKFKQQLKLQRLESLLRYGDMIKANK